MGTNQPRLHLHQRTIKIVSSFRDYHFGSSYHNAGNRRKRFAYTIAAVSSVMILILAEKDSLRLVKYVEFSYRSF